MRIGCSIVIHARPKPVPSRTCVVGGRRVSVFAPGAARVRHLIRWADNMRHRQAVMQMTREEQVQVAKNLLDVAGYGMYGPFPYSKEAHERLDRLAGQEHPGDEGVASDPAPEAPQAAPEAGDSGR